MNTIVKYHVNNVNLTTALNSVPEGRRRESPSSAVPLLGRLLRGLPEHRGEVVGVGGVERGAVEDPVAVRLAILALKYVVLQ